MVCHEIAAYAHRRRHDEVEAALQKHEPRTVILVLLKQVSARLRMVLPPISLLEPHFGLQLQGPMRIECIERSEYVIARGLCLQSVPVCTAL